MAAFKELINAELNIDYPGQSAVAGAGATEVKISKTLQEDYYFPPVDFEAITTQKLYLQQYITQEIVPIHYVNTVI